MKTILYTVLFDHVCNRKDNVSMFEISMVNSAGHSAGNVVIDVTVVRVTAPRIEQTKMFNAN